MLNAGLSFSDRSRFDPKFPIQMIEKLQQNFPEIYEIYMYDQNYQYMVKTTKKTNSLHIINCHKTTDLKLYHHVYFPQSVHTPSQH